MWIDDANIEEVGLTNVLRRDDYPLVVKGEDGTIYAEGMDYEPVHDDLLGVVPYPGMYDIYHASPTIYLTNNSRIEEGQRLRLSFYSVFRMSNGAVTVSMTDPEAKTLFREEICQMDELFKPAGYLMESP